LFVSFLTSLHESSFSTKIPKSLILAVLYQLISIGVILNPLYFAFYNMHDVRFELPVIGFVSVPIGKGQYLWCLLIDFDSNEPFRLSTTISGCPMRLQFCLVLFVSVWFPKTIY